ncbi:hypothetical protein HBI56_049950 [Parastagonospora nodorum]|uniref:Uncharacterized protein n=1 Tax=Phaeosphaeria nodorum (strain SN15 / ATCC MYA-4574 / FGSC 10173) TaxID=321614 RepID=A0A7U2ES60_PHANO|nr:hypothetical protein HBH56_062880 [Parastagonospora nodorum]QRC92095.1 hypothetical protein JI435_022600 [Parastagonospora nodorum SN15]KAH3931059.1 hypothetical protein HBH54_106820 [Parastagonospora nodorum]KAH3954203.1 hypothetical protein HBH53_021760 [Parastagonospora nodorum]KAH3968006.1 hypothetical protein HBH51_131910 [Parastagonospora nodorum]
MNWLVTAKCWVVSCGSCSPNGKAPALLKMTSTSALHRNLKEALLSIFHLILSRRTSLPTSLVYHRLRHLNRPSRFLHSTTTSRLTTDDIAAAYSN